jgi:hypothetical protein
MVNRTVITENLDLCSALKCFIRIDPRSPYACSDGALPLPKPVKGAMLAAKLLVSAEFRLKPGCDPNAAEFGG